MRKATQIAGAAAIAAMLLSGCGSSGGDKETPPSKSPESGPSTPGGADKPANGAAVDGAWEADSSDGKLILAITKGTVALSNGTKAACLGKVQEMAGTTMAALKCTNGDDTRTMGTLKPGADGKSLTVDWKNGPTEKYTKSTDGSVKIPDMPELPSGVPSMPKS
ncbi:hypothetical protein FCH28_18890 [Streptomyces piniterrae]|uniref:Lipoprotein n=1 Tax=Streptomyces piniterrae TaxID=2571125 RepID=A0A4U0ND90_9ACTN|nr:hypothetical protein [Streptomyces piniterrae]TJZ51930.1 hypothetical protein FCH28_18890 [Streptomyces piniterrae]